MSKPHNYSNAELTDMVLIYGEARCITTKARSLYMERFPARRVPSPGTFSAIVQRLRDYGQFVSMVYDTRSKTFTGQYAEAADSSSDEETIDFS